MNRRTTPLTLCALALAVSAGASCANLEATFFGPTDSISLVDDLSTRIEEVHVASEVGKERASAAVDTLRSICSSDFRGDATVAHAELVGRIDASEEQAEILRSRVDDMKDTATRLFERWAEDLEGFTNAEMRQRSQLRLEETRSRYGKIVAEVDPALWSYDAINRGLRDHALFLGHDFNRSSVVAVKSGVDSLGEQRDALDDRLESSMIAAQEYLDSAAPPGGVAAEPPSPDPSK